jgi:hypothetical protein
MTLTADQYAQIAQGFDSVAADPLVPNEKRREFAKQAEWFHYLAAREKGGSSTAISEEACSESPRQSNRALLTTLWLTGAAIYLIATLLFSNAVGLFGDRDRPSQVAEVRLPVAPPLSVNEKATGASDPHVITAGERRHAIAPDQPPYEAPELIKPLPVTEKEEIASAGTSLPGNLAAPAGSPLPETFKVIKAAKVRNGPSSASKIIGTAAPGAELQVSRQENGWIQFVDPSSGNSGWIQADVVAIISSTEANRAMPAPPEVAPPQPRKSQAAKRKPSPSKTVRSAKTPLPKQERGYAGLPDDEEFSIERGSRRMGVLARRRMLRQGLMSPDFQPPQ